MVGRRALLVAAAAGAGAALAGCGSKKAPPPARGPDWAALRSRLGTRLVLPADAGYPTARLSYDPLFDTRKPAAVARCASTADVQACLETARGGGLPVAARSGGHSYAGYSTPDGALVVDVSAMAAVRVAADGTATIGAGARLIDVYVALAAAGRALPAGSGPSVGIAGLTLGGGLGPLARKYGLTCDHLRSAAIVTADGKARTASASSEPDLFWALRGGGGGNFGVVTELTFDTVPAPDLTTFVLHFPGGAAGDVFGAWQGWIHDAPDELWSNCVLTPGAQVDCRVGGYLIGTPGTLDGLLSNLYQRSGAQPASSYVQPMDYLTAMRYAAGCTSLTTAQCHLPAAGGQLGRESFVASSRVLTAPVGDTGAIVDLVAAGGPALLFDGLHGALARVGARDTAFPHRTALATVQIYLDTTAAGEPAARRAIGDVRDRLGDLLGPHGYVNYIDPDLPDWASAYYGGNLDRLRRVAHRYDPDLVFRFAQGLA
jgi:FAD/FMN-containing dehydrogenase